MTATVLRPPTFGVSISDSPDLASLGLGPGHLREAMAEIAIQLLASGANLVYGGDLRRGGFTELLLELVRRYRRPHDADKTKRVTNYFAWPVHIQWPPDELKEVAEDLRGVATVVLVGPEGERLRMEERQLLPARVPSHGEWNSGLTEMRRIMVADTDARIVLGGRVDGYHGRMPGIAEEALLSFHANQPLFVLGGFGGCARDIAAILGLVAPSATSGTTWPGRRQFKRWTVSDIRNGLTLEENRILARTPYIDEILVLVRRGIHRVRNGSTQISLTKDGNGDTT